MYPILSFFYSSLIVIPFKFVYKKKRVEVEMDMENDVILPE